MNIARVFPRKTKASPDDPMAFFGPPGLMLPEIKKVHISVTFSWDIKVALELEKYWKDVAPVEIGGPAMETVGEEFIPGKYLKEGYVITSRGCPNKCWFCKVWKRDGDIRELEIKNGWNVLDDNLLACSEEHIRKVFDMLSRQKQRPEFTGGLESARLKPWMIDLLIKVNPSQMFFAYDSEEKYESMVKAGKMLVEAGFRINQRRCFVLIGYPKDTIQEAEIRLWNTVKAGFLPMAMLWRGEKKKDTQKNKEWDIFQRIWTRPAIIKSRIKEINSPHVQGLFF